MVLATLVGYPLGAVAGLALGTLASKRLIPIQPNSYLAGLAQEADTKEIDDDAPTVQGTPVGPKELRVLNDSSLWLTDPDHQRVQFIATILQLIWPVISGAIFKEVQAQAKQPIEDACKMTKGLVKTIEIVKLDLGTIPPKLDSFRVMKSEGDELMIEAPIFWGSDLQVEVAAMVNVPKIGLVQIPVKVSNVQMKAIARITVKPLVETLPCVGGITLSLKEAPYVGLDCSLANSADLIALPFIPEAIKLAILLVVGKLLVLPNEMSFPIMENYGVPPPPQGMLRVKVVRGSKLKSQLFDKVDPFVTVEVREGKPLQTSTIDNTSRPEWNEDMVFVVDDPTKQTVKITCWDEDIMNSDIVGVAEIPLDDADFMLRPGHITQATIPIREAPPKNDTVDHPEASPEAGEKLRELKGNTRTDAEQAGAVVHIGPGGTLEASESDEEGDANGTTPRRGLLERLGCGLSSKKKEHRRRKESEHTSQNVSANPEDRAAKPADPKDDPSGSKQAVEAAKSAGDEAALNPRRKEERIGKHRGKHTKTKQGDITGYLTFEFKYVPFQSTSVGKESESEPQALQRIQTFTRTDDEHHGLLSVYVKRCIALAEEADTYVKLTLCDPARGAKPDTTFKTPLVLEEQNPQYRYKMDFVNISAASTLTLEVYQRPGVLSNVVGKIPFVKKAEAKQLGYVRLKAADIAKEGRISDVWALQEAETGQMDLAVEWIPVDVDDEIDDW